MKLILKKIWQEVRSVIVWSPLAFIVLIIVLEGYAVTWTGFSSFTKPSSDYVPAKTLWDWMQLLSSRS